MKINKKELKLLTNIYNNTSGEYRDGIKSVLMGLDLLTIVKNEIFKKAKRYYSEQLETIEKLVKKQYNKECDFDLLEFYKNDLQYMDKLTSEEKKQLEACINLLV